MESLSANVEIKKVQETVKKRWLIIIKGCGKERFLANVLEPSWPGDDAMRVSTPNGTNSGLKLNNTFRFKFAYPLASRRRRAW